MRGHQWEKGWNTVVREKSSFLLVSHRGRSFSEPGMMPCPSPLPGTVLGRDTCCRSDQRGVGEAGWGVTGSFLCSYKRHEEGMFCSFGIPVWGCDAWICCSHFMTRRGMIYRPKTAEEKSRKEAASWWVYWAAELSKLQNHSTLKLVIWDDKLPLWLNHF